MVGAEKEGKEIIKVKNETEDVIKIRERDRIGGALPTKWVTLKPGMTANMKVRPDYAKKKGLTVVGAEAVKSDIPSPEPEVKAVLGRVSGRVIETKKKDKPEKKE